MEAKHLQCNMENQLKINRYLSTPRNNELVLAFIKAKENGAYERLVFDRKINSPRTAIKKIMNIKKIDQYFQKDFIKITEKEMLKYRDLLNEDKIFKDHTLVEWNNGKPKFRITNTTDPLSYRTKIDYRSNFCEFWKFVIEYCYQEKYKQYEALKKKGRIKSIPAIDELPNIMRYFKLQKPEDFEEIKVDYIPDDSLLALFNNIKNRHFKAYVQLSLMSGARPCEAVKIRYGKLYNLYKNQNEKWIIKLPRIKGISFKKYPMEIDMYEDELIPYFKSLKLKEGDYVFRTTEITIAKLMRHYSTKYLNHKYTPKILRKTARMLRTNAGYGEQWINKLMGHSPASRIQAHYVNHEGIKNEPIANERLKAQQYPSLKRDYEQIKLQMQAQQEQMKHIKESIMEDLTKSILKKLSKSKSKL